MTATATYGTFGDAYIDGLLTGRKWAVNTLTYSFPSSGSFYGSAYGSGENLNGFEAFTAVQQAATRNALNAFSSVINLSFSEVTESTTFHGELRFAESDSVSTAWGYYPSTSAAGGDMWFNNSNNFFEAPVRGNYAFLTILHETGHALGLKHAHEASGVFAALPADKDSLEYTVMSYRSYIGGPTTGYTNGAGSYPQSLMMFDIAALQKLYGANYSTNAGDTVYQWNAATGETSLNGQGQGLPAGNKIFLTIWDGGGNDTYSFANYATGVAVDLNPGGWSTSSAAQLASLGSGRVAIGNIANALLFNGSLQSLIENAIGGAGNDTIFGNQGVNRLTGGGGNDTLNGRDGTDIATYSGNDTDYSLTHNADGSWSIADLRALVQDGIDTLWNIEQLFFANTTLALVSGGIEPPPPPPVTNIVAVAVNDNYGTKIGTKLVVGGRGVLANDSDADGDSLTAILVSTTQKGKLLFNADGTFTYTPNRKFAGTDSFTYVATDGQDNSVAATVKITVSTTGVVTAAAAGHGTFDVRGSGESAHWSGDNSHSVWQAHAPHQGHGDYWFA